MVKKRKVAPRGKGNNKVYFTRDTEKAIVAYNKSEDSEERENIYRTHIQRPLDKLAENIINRFKFPYMNNSFEDVKAQVVSFLVINLHKYTENKGKAFSYFSVIAKNYLILHNNSGYKNEKRAIYLSDKTEVQNSLEEMISVDNTIEESHSDASEFVKLLIEYWDNNLTRIFKKKRDIEIANAIIELFRRADGIENFNKKALYLMVREMTNYKTSAITKVVNKMRTHVKKQMKQYRNTGTIDDMSKFLSY